MNTPITFEYSLLPGLERTGVLAPMLPITLMNGIYSFSTIALVDSGAQRGLISTVIADELHIKWKNFPIREGFSTGGNFLYHEVGETKTEIVNISFRFNLNVVEGIYAFKCILGRSDIFRVAKITFEGYKKQFHLDLNVRGLN